MLGDPTLPRVQRARSFGVYARESRELRGTADETGFSRRKPSGGGQLRGLENEPKQGGRMRERIACRRHY
jgi:hypothetical protein